ncbi:hypothetical protein LD39_00005 [Halobacillus sp. BBL2006]|nr:hypothetical protein LD39_00005 [Halobacillus sp. BBL2006]
MLVESIRWKVEPFEVEKIKLKSESDSDVTIGPYGELKEVPAIKDGEYYYQSYHPPSSRTRLLAPIKANGNISIKEALMEMKEDKNLEFISPAVSDHVHFQSISEEGERLNIKLTHGEWKDEQEVLTTVDSILMTARQFGFEEVVFNGVQFQPFPAYDLSEPIKVPEQINSIIINK